jgi:autotransporter passenger strand-loop-strand repeat protein
MPSNQQLFLNALFEDLLHRPIDATSLASYESALNGGATDAQVALSVVTSNEYYTDLVTSYYQQYLGRTPSGAESSQFVSLFGSGASEEQVQSAILSSTEYFTRIGGTNTQYVTSLYQNLLARTPSSTEIGPFVAALQGLTLTRNQVAQDVLLSAERANILLSYDTPPDTFNVPVGLYVALLGRQPSSGELSAFATAFTGLSITDQTEISQIIGSSEFLSDATSSATYTDAAAQVSGFEVGANFTLKVISGGTASSTLVDSGGTLFVADGTAANTTILAGGSATIASGSTDTGVVLSGGSQFVFGTATSAVLDANAIQTVESGGVAISATVSDTASQVVLSSGTAIDTIVNGGGTQIVSSGATASGTTISGSGAVLDLLSGAVVGGGITFSGSGGQLQITGSAMPSNTISGFVSGDTFDLATIAFDSSSTANLVSSGGVQNQLQITASSTTYDLQLNPSESFAGDFFHLGSAGSGTLVTENNSPCYCRGTMILTERGEVAVEDLAIGDAVVTVSGEARPIKWIGRRAYDGRFVTGNRAVLPIRIEAGALDDGVPARDLLVSPEHALYIDGVLVPAGLLVNGATITQVERIDRLEYFHIELDTHEVILAEGAPAESFVDCDNRGMFQNGAEFARLYPGDTRPTWDFCAKRLEEASAELTAIRAALRERAGALGYRFTDDPDLHLLIAGEVVRGHAVEENFYSFTIPAGSGAIWLASRSAVPAEVEAASPDRRRLGVLVKRIVLRDDDLRTEIGCGHASLRQGFHENEGSQRWTDGMARLPDELLRPFAGDFTIEVHLIKPRLRYALAAPGAAAGAPHPRHRSACPAA